jgi:hypothetical protein
MRKIPVLGTILFAYRFVFVRILDIVRVTWIAVVVNVAAGTLLRDYFTTQQARMEAGDIAAARNYVTLLIAVVLTILFFNGVAAVGITRLALGQSTSRGVLYFPVGRTEWRMFGANIRYFLGVFALFFLAGGVTLLAFSLAGIDPQQPVETQEIDTAGLVALLLALAMTIYAMVSMLRMGFLLPATIVAETHGGVRRAHELTKGNFLRILAVAIVVIVPLLLLFGIRNELARDATGTLAVVMNFFFNGVLSVLFWGLWFAAAAYAYTTIAGPAEPVPRS